MRHLKFRGCSVRVWNDDYMETVYPDGKICKALFTVDEHQKQTAKLAGYGDNVLAMHREHDIAHTFLAEVSGRRYSPLLYEAAGGPKVSVADRVKEETRVLAFQRYVQIGEISGALFDVANDLPRWKAEFQRVSKLLWEEEREKSE